MADKDFSRTMSLLREVFTRKQMEMGATLELFDGDNTSGQTVRLNTHAQGLIGVGLLYEGSTEFKAGDGKWLKHVGSLTSEARGYTFTEDNLITFGDGTDGFKPADTSTLENYCYYVAFYPVIGVYKPDEVTLTWTNVNVSDDNAPTTDTEVWTRGSAEVGLFFNTTGPTGGSTFDLKVIFSVDDGTTYSETDALQPFTAQAITKKYPNAIDAGSYDKIKARLDVIGVNMGAGKSVTLKIQPVWRY